MAQSHRSTQHPPGHQDAVQPPTPPPAPVHRQPMPPMMSPVVSDRQLMEQLRQIYQTANRHMPVPSGTQLSKSLTDTLSEISDIAEKAVEAYKP